MKPLAMMAPVHSGTVAPATAPSANTPITSPVLRTRAATALTPAPRNMASPRMTRGEARSVERRARPAVVSTRKDLMADPTVEGSA